MENIERLPITSGKLVRSKARVAVGHGQMSARFLEEIMLKFLKYEIDILVSRRLSNPVSTSGWPTP